VRSRSVLLFFWLLNCIKKPQTKKNPQTNKHPPPKTNKQTKKKNQKAKKKPKKTPQNIISRKKIQEVRESETQKKS